jgi:hypothetical protein
MKALMVNISSKHHNFKLNMSILIMWSNNYYQFEYQKQQLILIRDIARSISQIHIRMKSLNLCV